MKMKVLITVKAYPAISTKYGETVCTAGILENGDWIRIYPLPFRKLNYKDRFKKYEWIELDLIRNTSDFRPESFRPTNLDDFRTVGFIPPDGDAWDDRRKHVLKKVYTNLRTLITEAKDKNICTSLATFKPAIIHDFIFKPVSKDWDTKKLLTMESQKRQGVLFDTDDEKIGRAHV